MICELGVCVCVCVCMGEREREKREKQVMRKQLEENRQHLFLVTYINQK